MLGFSQDELQIAHHVHSVFGCNAWRFSKAGRGCHSPLLQNFSSNVQTPLFCGFLSVYWIKVKFLPEALGLPFSPPFALLLVFISSYPVVLLPAALLPSVSFSIQFQTFSLMPLTNSLSVPSYYPLYPGMYRFFSVSFCIFYYFCRISKCPV